MITIFDFETTSLNTLNCEITQFAYTMLNEDFKEIESNSFYVKANIDDTSEASKITGIKYDFLQKHGKTQEEFLNILKEVYNKSNYLVAHNGKSFDFIILNRLLNVNCESEKCCVDTIKDLSVLSQKEEIQDTRCFYEKLKLKKDYNSLVDLLRKITDIHIPDKLNLFHSASFDVFCLTAIILELRRTEQLFLDYHDKLKNLKTYRVFFKYNDLKFKIIEKNKTIKWGLQIEKMIDENGCNVIINNKTQWEEMKLEKTDLQLEKLKQDWKFNFDAIYGQDYMFVKEKEYQNNYKKNKTTPWGKKIERWDGVRNKYEVFYE